MIGLLLGLAAPVFVLVFGAFYALYLDPKTTLPRGDFRRLR